MWAAIRHRRSQSVLLVLVSALVTAIAVFAPLFVRTLEQGLLRVQVTGREPADLAVTLRGNRSALREGLYAAQLDALVPAEAARWFGRGIGMTTADTEMVPAPGRLPSPVKLLARDGVCEHLDLFTGRCPRATGEVLVSAADAATWSWAPGRTFDVPDPSAGKSEDGDSARGASVQLTVVGVYTVRPDPGYWLRTTIDGKSGVLLAGRQDLVPAVDDLVTAPETFDGGWAEASVSNERVLDRAQVSLDTVPLIRDSLDGIGGGQGDITVTSPVAELVASVASGRAIVRSLVPLLLVQVALLAVTALALVAQAAVEQRRPEVALARLRGRSAGGSARLVVGELALTVLLGIPSGLGLALLGDELLRRFVMPRGVPVEVGWPVAAAAVLALAVSLAVVVLAARRVVREPVATLLRRVAGGRRRPVGVLDTVVVVVAVLAVVGVLTGDVGGASALLTPVLLGLAVGLVATAALRAAAARFARRSVRSGRLVPALAAFSLARRPAVRGVVVAVTTATALVTFAVSAVVVAERNRADRAQLETGAPTVLDTDADSAVALAAAVDRLDPELRRTATPVVVVRPRDASAVDTVLARPAELERIAFPVDGVRLAEPALTPTAASTVILRGEAITATLEWRFDEFRRPGEGSVEAPRGITGAPRAPTSPPTAPVLVGITVTTPAGETLDRTLAQVPQRATGSVAVRARVLCPDTCRLAGLWVRQSDPVSASVAGRMTMSGLALDGAPLAIGDTAGWRDPPAGSGSDGDSQRVSGAGTTLSVDVDNTGRRLVSTRADVPDPAPVLLAGAPPADAVGDAFTLVGLGGRPVAARAVQRVPALPVLTGRGALIDLDAALRVGGDPPDGSALQVWTSTTGRAATDRLAAGLAEGGVRVAGSATAERQQDRYDRSATGWGLLLGAFTGVVAVLVALLVVVVAAVTSWRGVARDLAGLRVAGVPPAVVAASLRGEQLFTVLTGAVLGTVCGVAGTALAMPLVPIFDDPAPVPVPDLAPSWGAIGLAAGLTLAVVGAVALASARLVAARTGPARIRESA